MARLSDPHPIIVFIFTILLGAAALNFGDNYQIKAKEPVSPVSGDLAVIKEIEPEFTEYVPVEVPRLPQTIEEEIRAVFGKDAEKALKVFQCESGLRPKAYNKNTNGSIDVGLAQINSIHGVNKRFLENPSINIRVAKQLFDEQGGSFGPWVCAKKLGVK